MSRNRHCHRTIGPDVVIANAEGRHVDTVTTGADMCKGSWCSAWETSRGNPDEGGCGLIENHDIWPDVHAEDRKRA